MTRYEQLLADKQSHNSNKLFDKTYACTEVLIALMDGGEHAARAKATNFARTLDEIINPGFPTKTEQETQKRFVESILSDATALLDEAKRLNPNFNKMITPEFGAFLLYWGAAYRCIRMGRLDHVEWMMQQPIPNRPTKINAERDWAYLILDLILEAKETQPTKHNNRNSDQHDLEGWN